MRLSSFLTEVRRGSKFELMAIAVPRIEAFWLFCTPEAVNKAEDLINRATISGLEVL